MRYFEGFSPGERFSYGRERITREDIFAFARRYDPQPMHLDDEAAKMSLLGGLAASGLHTNSLLVKMTVQHLLADTACLGMPGIKQFRWFRPVRPDEILTVEAEVLGTRPSSLPDRGLVDFRFDMSAVGADRVLTLEGTLLFARRTPGDRTAPHDAEPLRVPAARYCVGRFTFTEENIVAFAREFDPKPWLVDREAAGRGPFGGLVASCWHIACVNVAVALVSGEADHPDHPKRSAGRRGPSPGWHDVRWIKPVRPGDTIDFYRDEASWRLSASRPGWGLLGLGTTADNQHGETVFSCIATIMVETPA
jgi:acyl dehydratase